MEKQIVFTLFDFDNTAADTFEPNVDGINVDVAYRMAADVIFGKSCGEKLYDEVGGLQNRAPGQLIKAMLGIEDRLNLVAIARRNIEALNGELEGFVPEGKGRPLHWNGDHIATIAEALVRVKLKILMKEIGTAAGTGDWPRPMPGFCRLWKSLTSINERLHCSVNFVPVILSSGHDLFIERCFNQWGLAPPKYMVTDDTMRSPIYDGQHPDQRAKPNTFPVEVFLDRWSKDEGVGLHDGFDPFRPLSFISGRAIVAGDCPRADGGLATNINAPFVWLNRTGAEPNCSLPTQTVQVRNHWLDDFGQLFLSETALTMMGEGKPMSAVVAKVFGC